MKVVDLNGSPYSWKLSGYIASGQNYTKSSLHETARQIIFAKFATLQLLEEVPIYVTLSPKHILYLDFYLPLRKLAIEVHGEQHFKYNSFFYKTQSEFLKQKSNDRKKEQWCEMNGIEYKMLPYDGVNDWGNMI